MEGDRVSEPQTYTEDKPMAMRLQKKPDRNKHNTPASREVAIEFKKKHGKQAYWRLLGASVGAALKRDRKRGQLLIQAALLLKDEGYNKYPMKAGGEDDKKDSSKAGDSGTT
jgi:hypothetical protein